jgi:ketosteroid isomerase-like protein
MQPDRSDEARATYRRYVDARERVQRGEAPWSHLAGFFTEDAVYVDPAWGRTQGRAAIARFLDDSMAGLDGWTFPEEWTMVEGDRVVSFWWNRLPGVTGDGRPLQAPGVSILRYAGDGRFDYELDVLNLAEVFELMKRSDWVPSAAMLAPPEHPDRDASPPARGRGESRME